MKIRFKKQYILGRGYPWFYGIDKYFEVGINENAQGMKRKLLNIPNELWNKDLPEYELILRRVK